MKTSEDFLVFLREWEGTPYANKMQSKGRGVDCVNFAAAYCDWVSGVKSDVLSLPKMLGYSDPKKTLSVIRTLERSWDLSLVDFKDKDITSVLMPGDLIATQNGSHPVHLVLVGPRRGTIWHASNERSIPGIGMTETGVRISALSTATIMGISRVWRLDEAKNMRWLKDKTNACC